MMRSVFTNNLYTLFKQQRVCTAFGIRLSTSPQVVQLAHTNGYDTVFIDLEHSVLNEEHASSLCTTAMLCGITPFVRVPHQCDSGFVQRVLDGGAMGIIFPHVSSAADAATAVSMCKFPPMGKRSMTGQLPHFGLSANPHAHVIEQMNGQASTVGVMIETSSAIDNVESIAATAGVDLLLVGSNDLSLELDVSGNFRSTRYQGAVEAVSKACKSHGKVFGLAGIYDTPDLQSWAINDLGARFILAQQDSGWIAKGSKSCMEELKKILP